MVNIYCSHFKNTKNYKFGPYKHILIIKFKYYLTINDYIKAICIYLLILII